MALGLGASLSKTGLATPGIVTDSLVLKHNYAGGGVTPVSDGAAFFDGTDDYITMGDVTSFDGANDLTISVWINYTDASATIPIVTKGNYNTAGDSFFLGYEPQISSGKLAFSVDKDSTNGGAGIYFWVTSMNTYIPINTWTHVAAVYSNTADTFAFYVNGVSHAIGGTAGVYIAIPSSEHSLQIGQNPSSAHYEGYICNVGIWSVALTQAQVKSIMWKNYAGLTDSDKEAGTTTGTPNLVSWWNLDVETSTSGVAGGTGGVADSHGSNHGELKP